MNAQIHLPEFAPEPYATVRRAKAEGQRTKLRAFLDGLWRTAAAGALSAAISFGVWQGYQWATGSPRFALEKVEFTGLTHAAESDLLRRSSLTPGTNVFRADLARAARGIETHPWVVSARLERKLPHGISVDVLEHRPVALVQLGSLYVLDDQARLFKRAVPEDGLDLPLVTGLAREDWEARKADLQLRMFTALQLLDAWQAQGFTLASLSEVRLEEGGTASLFAHDGEGVQEIRLGSGEYALKLKRLAQIRSTLQRRGEHATKIDLDNPSRPDQATAALAQKHR